MSDQQPLTPVQKLRAAVKEVNASIRENGFAELLPGSAMPGGIAPFGTQMNSAPFTLSSSNSYSPVTLNRVTLAYAYMTHGLVESLVQQPVLDAFKGGVRISSGELNDEDCALINHEINRNRAGDRDRGLTRQTSRTSWESAADIEQSDVAAVMEARFWARLFGGSGLIVNTTQDFRTPLDKAKITKGTPLEFIPADRWELVLSTSNIHDERTPRPFSYYGLPLHRSRVVKSMGTKAPSLVRMRLQGWGMSALERALRPINAFLKFENVVFELLDEAKLDIFKIQGFNASLLDPMGSAMTRQRLMEANQLKSVMNSLAMDAEDAYERKQMNFAGLSDLWNETRMNLCSALKMPMTKLFGVSASGFGSGADSAENYASLCQTERDNSEDMLRMVIDLRCMQHFGYTPKYEVSWEPLRVLDGEQEQMVLTAKQNRIIQLQTQGLLDGKEASLLLRREGLLSMETQVSRGLVEAIPQATQAAMIGNENQLTRDKRSEKREDKPRNQKQAGGPVREKKS